MYSEVERQAVRDSEAEIRCGLPTNVDSLIYWYNHRQSHQSCSMVAAVPRVRRQWRRS